VRWELGVLSFPQKTVTTRETYIERLYIETIKYFVRRTFGSAPSANGRFITNFETLQRPWRRNPREFRPLSDSRNILRNQSSYLTVPAYLALQSNLTPGRGDGGGGQCSKEVTMAPTAATVLAELRELWERTLTEIATGFPGHSYEFWLERARRLFAFRLQLLLTEVRP